MPSPMPALAAYLLEVSGGPLDGTSVAAHGQEFVGGVPGSGVGHLYVRSLDDCGAMYWQWRGPVSD